MACLYNTMLKKYNVYVKEFDYFWIVFWNDSRRFGVSTRSLGHMMFSFTWPRLLVNVVNRFKIRSKVSQIHSLQYEYWTLFLTQRLCLFRYDFFIVSQSVRQGTVTPTAYNVVMDTSGMKPDHMQRLTYKLCHLYYNWPVSITHNHGATLHVLFFKRKHQTCIIFKYFWWGSIKVLVFVLMYVVISCRGNAVSLWLFFHDIFSLK